jgi:hypothetical protein
MSRHLSSVICFVVSLCAAGLASGQTDPVDVGTPAHISVVQGAAVLERRGAGEPAVENLPLLEGDRLRSETARMEIILPDGSVLDLDKQTTVDLLAGGLLRMTAGRMIFVVSIPRDGDVRDDYQVDAPAGSVRFLRAGEYRLTTLVSEGVAYLDLAVVRGEAAITVDGQTTGARAGQRVQVAQGQGVTATGTFNSAQSDAFVAWADGLRTERVGTRSNAYLPPELQVYGGTFDQNGTWDNSGDYGYVWYPNVQSDWRPYYDGAWQPYGWGWTWVGGGPWVWPTHHYGRWGHGSRGWYWMPGAQWGPAWVSWGTSAGYVSWCPLGYNDAPVFSLSFGVGFGAPYSPWLGWTVVPYGSFGHGHHVPSYAVHGDHLRAVPYSSFAVGRGGPAVPGAPPSRHWDSNGGATPYGRGQAVSLQRGGTTQGWGASGARDTAGQRPAAQPRSWSNGAAASSSYNRPQAGQGNRLPQSGSDAARSRAYDTRAFSSPSQAQPRSSGSYRPPSGSASPETLADVAGRAASSPARGGSRSYYLGPSESRPRTPLPPTPSTSPNNPSGSATSRTPRSSPSWNGPSTAPSPAPSQGSATPFSAAPRAAPRSYQDYMSSVRGSSQGSTMPNGAAMPRSYSEGRSYSTAPSSRPSPSYQGGESARPAGPSSSGGGRPSGAGMSAPGRVGGSGGHPSSGGGGGGRPSGGGGAPARGGRGR